MALLSQTKHPSHRCSSSIPHRLTENKGCSVKCRGHKFHTPNNAVILLAKSSGTDPPGTVSSLVAQVGVGGFSRCGVVCAAKQL